MKRILVIGSLVAAFVALPAVPAGATFPDDNGRIAFRRFLDVEQTTGAVFTVNPDGTDELQVTHPPEGYVDRNPDVSPDGRRIVFQRQGPSMDDIFVVRSDGTGLRQLTNVEYPHGNCGPAGGECNTSPAWGPQGKRIVFSRGFGPVEDDLIDTVALFVMRPDGTHVRQITQRRQPPTGATGEDGEPQFSPDGTMVVFQRWRVRTGVPADGVALWTLDLRTRVQHRITPYRLQAGDTPDWSPDGERILFHDNHADQDANANLWTVRRDGTDLRQLTFADDGTTRYLGSSYSPDGRWITVGRRPATGGAEAGSADVFVMRAGGRAIRKVTRTTLYDSYPDWGPRVADRP